ncbi:hypothetical protein PR202_ga05340 [Eleusine coracana subsp. coracana]|uniref:MalT-like TPR region domain-containing protein n=1 Tax=Eleusine coracana subsp. coracana TaxID=191504 RepID=A0AAV5BSC3_ELECO|nr:hypothetical protein PR202_ga04887 [Eleusine coracana subsp. coracana]GJM89178.1 hypothetical protein PR202_ga05340 [Eleusine coracana subsp. coracana]
MLVAPKPRGPRQFAATAGETQPERVAAEMVRYALGGFGDSLSCADPLLPVAEEAMRILEQGALNLQGGGEGSAEAVGWLMLAMSTLLYRSGKRQDAIEKLKATQQVAPSAPFRVTAWESLMGLQMEAGQEISSSMSPNDSVDMSIKDDDLPDQEHLKFRVNAVKGLIALLNGETDSENATLSYGEYLHCVGDFSMATQVYERVLEAMSMEDMSRNLLAAGNMVPEEVSLGATSSYGQLLCHSGKFAEAEDYLTRALKKAEEQFGASHPKVGIVLTCIARMYKLKAKSEGSSSIMVQEGLYRKALEVLKAPAISSEGTSKQMEWRDIISLARGEYAALLLIQSNRKAEGERMKEWAQDAWRNRRLTLAQALEFTEPSKPTVVVDTRIGRVV